MRDKSVRHADKYVARSCLCGDSIVSLDFTRQTFLLQVIIMLPDKHFLLRPDFVTWLALL